MGRHASAHVLSIDAARGLLACSILAYHLLAWEKFGRVWAVGYYGIYGFFVISGFSLYLAYRDRLRSPADVAAYLLKRFWRIAPLFYVVCAARLLFVSVPEDAWSRLLLNLTLVFGFADPGATSLIVGGWSIGIELVFYVLFIPLIWMARGRTLALALITLASVALMINHADRTAGDWVAYTQPAAFFGYFAAGCLVAELYLRHSARLKGRAVFILLAAAALIPFALVRPETARDILVGGTGVTLMACTIVLITATAFISEPSGRLRQPAYWLGRLSYPIYLYHPVVYWALALAKVGGPGLRISLTLALTLALSYLTNVLVEEPCRRFGRRLAAGLRSRDDQIPVGDARTANPAPKA